MQIHHGNVALFCAIHKQFELRNSNPDVYRQLEDCQLPTLVKLHRLPKLLGLKAQEVGDRFTVPVLRDHGQIPSTTVLFAK